MFKKLSIALLTLMLSLTAFAGTPQGSVAVYLDNGACPQTPTNQISFATLDNTGVYTLGSLFVNQTPGSYCVTVSYNGGTDGQFIDDPSTGTTTQVVQSNHKSTQTNVVCSPNPSVQGNPVICTATVTEN